MMLIVYKQYTASDYRKFFNLEDMYRVDGLLVSGGWKASAEAERLLTILDVYDPNLTVRSLPEGFLGHGLEITDGQRKVWFFVEYGGARLSEVVHLACLFESKKNILVGVAGGLKQGIKAGQIIVSSKAQKDGSSSYMYSNGRSQYASADPVLSRILANKLGAQVVTGKTATCQAMLGETKEYITQWSYDGNVAVEMEAATLFSVSQHFSVPAAALLTIADNLIEDVSVLTDGFDSARELIYNSRNRAMAAAVEELFS